MNTNLPFSTVFRSTLTLGGLVLTALTSPGDLIVQFTEQGANTEVSFHGTLPGIDWALGSEGHNSIHLVGLNGNQGFVFSVGSWDRYDKPAGLDSPTVTGLDSFEGSNKGTPATSSLDYGAFVNGNSIHLSSTAGGGTRDAFIPTTKTYSGSISDVTGDMDGAFDVHYSFASNDGGVTPSYSVTFTTSAVPEPSSALLGAILLGMTTFQRRRPKPAFIM